MIDETLPEYVLALLQPRAYPSQPHEVELRQTHISYVFLADDIVYKTKKSVDFGFIEQLSLETRERFCHAEVTLNRRLAPNVYLGVTPVIRRTDGSYTVEENPVAGEIVEWAVKMRRLPDDRTLDRLLNAESTTPELITRLVQRLIAFHEAAAVVPNEPSYAGAAAELAWWKREYGEAEGFIGSTWQPEHAAITNNFINTSLERNTKIIDRRLADGRVVEGHGDLRAAHVYLLDNTARDIAIVDCIEFSEWFHFRYLDVGYDIAFLAMDLEALGYPDLADELAGRYCAATCDETFSVLQPLHRAFRAFVRGKVESIGAHAPEVPERQRQELATSAAAFFALAANYAKLGTVPQVIVMSGLPASGKSTVAGTLACRIGAAYLSSDAIRKQLAGINPREQVEDDFRTGLYSPEMTARTYGEMRRRAAMHLVAGRPVVLDATHGHESERAAARALASEHGVPHLIAELRLPDKAAHTRIASRESDPLRTSDATWGIYQAQRDSFETITSNEGPQLVFDATKPPAMLAREIAEAIRHP